MDIEIFEEHPPTEKNSNELISQLELYNARQKPGFVPDYEWYGYFIRDRESGRTLGGVVGWLWMGAVHIHRLFVEENLRGQGHGSILIKKAEDLALHRGCSLLSVETLSFQNTLQFYLKNGFNTVFEDKGYSLGISIHFLRKNLR